MPSGSSGRYQSRLFNFLNRQALRLTAQCDRAVRQLKVAAVWGVQIVLYPVYLLVQTGLSAGRQLSNSAQAGWPQLKEFTNKQYQKTLPAADTPIQQVLNEVSTLPLPKVQDTVQVQESQLPTPVFCPSGEMVPASQPELSKTAQESKGEGCVIQGVATLLATRTLVLVTVDNQVLDILTPQQQKKLSAKISWEVADLLRQRRLARSLEQKQATRRLDTLEQPQVFLPVKLFWYVMAWVQTSPVAIAANLFQESTLVSHLAPQQRRIVSPTYTPRPRRQLPASNHPVITTPQGVLQSVIGSTRTPRAIAFLDRTVAELESHQLVPGSEVIVALGESATRSLRDRTQQLLQPIQSKFMTPRRSTTSLEASQTNKFRIQALIYAAVDYFFGRRRSNLPQTGSQERSAIPPNPQRKAHQLSGRHSSALPPSTRPSNLELSDIGEPDPWLTWSDLFGNPDATGLAQNLTPPSQRVSRKGEGESQIPNPKSQVQLPEAFNGKIPVRPRNSVWAAIKRYLSPKQTPGKLSAPSTREPRVERPKSVVQIAKLKTQSTTSVPAPTKRQPLSPTVAASRSKSVSSAKEDTTAITTPSSPSSDGHLEPAPDWIETQATPTGYVKHPLEKLLGWLDIAMLWVEELVIKVWRWMQPRK
jgi:hypothetical protein